MDLHWLTIHEAADLICQKALSPVELTQAHLDRIEQIDPELQAYLTRTPDLALAQARQAEEEITHGDWRGPLHGIPLALKDLYDTAGVRTTAGTDIYRDRIPEHNACTVDALYKSGMALLGKLNMHEIALGLTNENPHYGACRNPWDIERIPGGSSGGSGAAVAAGLCMGSLGSDTGGSIRVPAALCGIVGLKPTRGRISLRGVMPLSWHLDHAGPMARCVRDVALLLQAIAGYDPEDPYSVNQSTGNYTKNLTDAVAGKRFALLDGPYFQDIEAGIYSAAKKAAAEFVSLGGEVEGIDIPGFEDAALENAKMIISEAACVYRNQLEDAPERFGDDVRQRLEMGVSVSVGDYIQARRVQAGFTRQIEQLFTRYDFLLLPAAPVTAPQIGGEGAVQRARQLTRFTSVFNLTGFPAIVLPCGFATNDGRPLPIGLQIVAQPWAEADLLQAAYAYEQASSWHTMHPNLPVA